MEAMKIIVEVFKWNLKKVKIAKIFIFLRSES